jgi:hypothetical protein
MKKLLIILLVNEVQLVVIFSGKFNVILYDKVMNIKEL